MPPIPAAGATGEETPASHQRSATRQETIHADIFVQIRPVDPLATGNQTPVSPLRRCPVRQTREPRERNRDRSAIRKVGHQSIVAYAYAQGQRSYEFTPRSIMP